ncbi:hypothetical protein [Massilia sp. X63]|uniref:hypothetical protein n=1 Tax=Massilia sp. X63 TaxID=3237285 RepID=UPI0034DD8565
MFKFCIVIFLLIPYSTCALAQASNMTIGKEEQQARDKDRHMILRTELVAEHQELAKAQGAFGRGGSTESAAEVHRREENIKALQRELAAVRDQSESDEPARLVARARQSAVPARVRRVSRAATFWNPYNRAPDLEIPTDFLTTP